ncbi:MAG: prolipoprotein diacylglyceryl transferase [Peptococcaceae bacterium]|nr:prolipoprotein diacylglyceryl transferase [Peptococcaceae bacterium]
MHQILFHAGPFTLRSYGLMMALGMAGGLALAWHLAGKKGKYREDILNMAVYVLLAGLLGARLWEVAFDWHYYGSRLAEIPALWRGGLSVQGGVAGGLLAVILYTRKHRVPFWEFGDILAPGVILGQAVGRVGCYLNGCCYGVPTDRAWGVVYPPGTDAYFAYGTTPLVPAVLFESAWDLAVMALLIFFLFRKPFDGFVTTLYFSLYAAGRIALEFYRADSLTVWGLKAAQVTSLATLLAALAVMFYLWRRGRLNP